MHWAEKQIAPPPNPLSWLSGPHNPREPSPYSTTCFDEASPAVALHSRKMSGPTVDPGKAAIPGWADEDYMATMYGPWHNGPDSVREQRLDFWASAIELVAAAHGIEITCISDLNQWFERDGVRPRCLNEVVGLLAALPTMRIAPLSQFRLLSHANDISNRATAGLLRRAWHWGTSAIFSLLAPTPSSEITATTKLVIFEAARNRCREIWPSMEPLLSQSASWVDRVLPANHPLLLSALHGDPTRTLVFEDAIQVLARDDPKRHVIVNHSNQVVGFAYLLPTEQLSQSDLCSVAVLKTTMHATKCRLDALESEITNCTDALGSERLKASSGTARESTMKLLLKKRTAATRARDKLLMVDANLRTLLDAISSGSDDAVIVATLRQGHAALKSVSAAVESADPTSVEDLASEIQQSLDEQNQYFGALFGVLEPNLEDAALESEYNELAGASTDVVKGTPVGSADLLLMEELESLSLEPRGANPTILQKKPQSAPQNG